MNQNKERLVNNLGDSVTPYRKMKEEASDPIALRFLADIVDDLEAELASLKVESQGGRRVDNENSPSFRKPYS